MDKPSDPFAGITHGKQIMPIYTAIYGITGVGKTNFASKAPGPIFLDLEGGSNQLDVVRAPAAGTLEEVTAQLTALYTKPHNYNAVVVDTLDALEVLIWRAVCAEANVKSIEDWGGGYGKGYVRAAEYWRDILGLLGYIRQRHHVILIGHAMVKTFQDPDQAGGYDRYQMKINEKAAALVRQAVDVVLFANYRTTLIRDKGTKSKGRGVGDGARVMFTEHRPAFDAKNRFNLPFEMPLEWKGFSQKIRAFYEPAPAAETPAPAALTNKPEEPSK